jgi:hypothetical protein
MCHDRNLHGHRDTGNRHMRNSGSQWAYPGAEQVEGDKEEKGLAYGLRNCLRQEAERQVLFRAA